MTRLKFCWEPVATVTEKVASCGWCFHGNHPQWPSEAERENVEKGRKKNGMFTEQDRRSGWQARKY